MNKESKDRLTRMIKAQSEMERRDHNSLRPMQDITIYLSCGCDSTISSDKTTIAPRIGTKLYCFSHMCEVRVSNVEVIPWTL